ncbi:MAG: biotin--[acetyl-CoA-carboxylase] ligase [Oligoflexia bacterium]|nr:biotin--[acetyl-CoA-carboxylase] ligase [Oligoflexia bacterium]
MIETNFDMFEVCGRVCRKPSFGWDFIGLEEVESTNEYSKEKCADFKGPTLIVAKHQTKGKGRGGKTWEDDGPNASFLSTWTVDLMGGVPDPRWTLGIGLYLFEALSEAFRTIRFGMKAPNDIYIDDKKVGGILVEVSSQDDVHYLHVGVGINVYSYPADMGAHATHLNAYLGSSGLTAETWTHFLEFFGNRLAHLEAKASGQESKWIERLSGRLVDALNRHPEHQSNPVKSIKPNGSLVLEKGEINWLDL